MKGEILKQLSLFGISERYLFPEFEHEIRAISTEYKKRIDEKQIPPIPQSFI